MESSEPKIEDPTSSKIDRCLHLLIHGSQKMFLVLERVSWWSSLTIAVPATLLKWGVSAVRVGPMLRIRCRDIGYLWIRLSLGWKELQCKSVSTERALQ